jgi:GT2 family glycosyltransferase
MSSPKSSELVSVIIPTRDRIDKVLRCIESVRKSTYGPIEIVVVDDASQKNVASELSGLFPEVKFIRNSSRRFLSCSRNEGAELSRGTYLFFLDDDNLVAPDAVAALVRILDEYETAAVACPVIYYLSRPSEVWTSYITRSIFPGFYRLRKEIHPDVMDTFSFHNSFMVKGRAFRELGGFDCRHLPIRFSEVDFAHRLHARGYRALVTPDSRVWHDLGWALVHIDSRRAYFTERNRMIIIKRYYNPSQFRFYAICILPFLSGYYLLHHSLSSTDGALRTAASFLRGIIDGLTFRENRMSEQRL